MSATVVERLREIPGGPMTEAEILYCRQVRDAVRAALDGRVLFATVVTRLWADFREIRKRGPELDEALAAGFRPSITSPDLSGGSHSMPVVPSAAEREFLADVDGFLDFALRNGLSFLSVLVVLVHDLVEIAAHGFDLEKAQAEGFLPKVSGWAQRNAEPVGEVEEPMG